MSFTALIHILYQTILTFPLIFGVLLALPVIGILLTILGNNTHFRSTKKTAIVIGIVGAIIALFGLPLLFKSSLSEINYHTDWLFHIVSVFCVFLYLFVVSWLFLASVKR